MISSSRLAELQHAPPVWKFCAAQSQERFDRENAQRAVRAKVNGRRALLIAGSGKPRHGREKHCPAARMATKTTSVRGRNRAGATRKDRSETPFVGLRICDSRRLSSCLAVGQQVGHERAHQSELGCKTDLETCGKYRELTRKLSERALTQRKARAREEPSPGLPFRDGRRTTGPPAPRRGPGAPTAQPRPRGPDLESAQI